MANFVFLLKERKFWQSSGRASYDGIVLSPLVILYVRSLCWLVRFLCRLLRSLCWLVRSLYWSFRSLSLLVQSLFWPENLSCWFVKSLCLFIGKFYMSNWEKKKNCTWNLQSSYSLMIIVLQSIYYPNIWKINIIFWKVNTKERQLISCLKIVPFYSVEIWKVKYRKKAFKNKITNTLQWVVFRYWKHKDF